MFVRNMTALTIEWCGPFLPPALHRYAGHPSSVRAVRKDAPAFSCRGWTLPGRRPQRGFPADRPSTVKGLRGRQPGTPMVPITPMFSHPHEMMGLAGAVFPG